MEDMNLPQDLTKCTKKQIKAIIAYHNTLTLSELRKRQAIVNEQKIAAYNARNTFAMNNLEFREKILFTVIFDGNYKQ